MRTHLLILIALLAAAPSLSAQTPAVITRVELDTPQGRTVSLRVERSVPVTVKAFDEQNQEVPVPASSTWLTGWLPVPNYVHCAKVENGLLTVQAGSTLSTCGMSFVVFNVANNTIASGRAAEAPITVTILPPLVPKLFTASAGRAIAVHSTLQTVEPFARETPLNLSVGSDTRTRIQVFVAGGDSSPASALQAEFARAGTVRTGVVEDVRATNIAGIWQVTVRLPDLPAGDYVLTIVWDGFRSTTGLVAVL